MMALELLDTKWAGIIQPTHPDAAQAGEVETEHILAPADGPRRTVTFRLRVYTATELARLLEDVGFAEIEALARSVYSFRNLPTDWPWEVTRRGLRRSLW